jgi:hypothetical protein
MGIRFKSLEELRQHSRRPGAVAMARNLGQSLVEWSASGFKTCEGDELTKRLDLCVACEYLINNRCLKCGCFVEVKARLATSKCPIGKWQPLTPPQS